MYIKVRVHAGEKKNILRQKAHDTYEIRVKAPALRGLANKAVIEMLAAHIKVEAKKLRLVKGASSPAKIFELIQ